MKLHRNKKKAKEGLVQGKKKTLKTDTDGCKVFAEHRAFQLVKKKKENQNDMREGDY